MPHRMILMLTVAIAFAVPAWGRDATFAWSEPPPDVQLEQDETPIPLGKGAIFVPSITGPLNEPPIILLEDGSDRVLDIPTGERVIVDPGQYVVIVSSGSPGQGVGQAVDVREARTSVVDVTWGALRIEVVDERRVPHRGGYEIIRSDSREPYGTGFGADTLQGERLSTWLLPPGVYRITRPGSNYRTQRDFSTVYVPAGGFVRYRIVQDPDTGELIGSGVLVPDEFGTIIESKRKWFASFVVGAEGSLTQQSNVVGVSNQLTAMGGIFADGQLAYNHERHTATALAQFEIGASRIQAQDGDPLPLVKTRDDLRLDTLYTYFVRPWFGPYVRATGETQTFATNVLVTEDTNLVRIGLDGQETREFVPANQTFFVANAWEPLLIREGAGINTRFVNNRWFTLNLRTGLGLRQNVYDGAFVAEGDLTTTAGGSELELRGVETFFQEGAEATLVATARLPGWAVYATDVELFADFQDFGRPSIEWRNRLTLRLTRNLSLNYFLDMQRIPQVVDTLQFEQSVLLRASWALL